MKLRVIILLTMWVSFFSVATPAYANCVIVDGKVVCPKRPEPTPGGGDLIIIQELRRAMESPKTVEDQIKELNDQIKVLEQFNG